MTAQLAAFMNLLFQVQFARRTTRSLKPVAALLVTLLGPTLLSPALLAQRPLVIENVTVLPMTAGNEATGPHTVVVREGRIATIGDAASDRLKRRAQVIDGSGRFLIPGLVDAHVHINRSDDDSKRLRDLFLLHGITTIINLEGSARVAALRDRIAAGEELGPTIVTSGAILRGSDRTTEEQGRRLVQMHKEAGYDLVKVYNPLSEAGYRGVVDEARKHSIPVVGHAVRSVGIDGALASGQHIVHMEEMVYGHFTWDKRPDQPAPGVLPTDVVERLDLLLDPSEIPELARRVKEAGIWVTPNLVAYFGIVEQTNDLEAVLAREKVAWMPESMRSRWQREFNGYVNRDNQTRFERAVVRTYPFLEQLTRAFAEAGVPLLAGTDVGIPSVVAGDSLHRELELLVAAGLSERQALRAATSSAALFLGRDDFGRIEVGARADLVLLAADPRQAISNTRKIEAVIVGGHVVDLGAIREGLP